MRGKPGWTRPPAALSGLIPAHAGKTEGGQVNRVLGEAHPRACGENDWTDLDTNGAAGSSPRMRGKLTAKSLTPFHSGLIPAHAGKTINLDGEEQ